MNSRRKTGIVIALVLTSTLLGVFFLNTQLFRSHDKSSLGTFRRPLQYEADTTQSSKDIYTTPPRAPANIPFFDEDNPRHQAYPYKCLPQNRTEGFDVVYLWVNGSDAWYQEVLDYWRGQYSVSNDVAGKQRFRDNNELKYSMRSVYKYLNSWARYVHLVVNGNQMPTWMNRTKDGIFIVPHRAIFERPDDDLPTFNTFAIKANLHRIPNLADRYIVVDDDMLFSSDGAASPALYVDPNTQGHYIFLHKPHVQKKTDIIAAGQDKLASGKINSEWRAIYTSNRYLQEHIGPTDRWYPAHIPGMIDRSLQSHIVDEFQKEFDETISHRFRTTDIHMQFFYNNYALMVAETKRDITFDLAAMWRQQLDWDKDGVLNDCEVMGLTEAATSAVKICKSMALTAETTMALEKAQQDLESALSTFSQTEQEDRTLSTLDSLPVIVDALRGRYECLNVRWKAAQKRDPKYRFVQISDAATARLGLKRIDLQRPPLVCLNDDIKDNQYDAVRAIVGEWYEKNFPVPSPWELDSPNVWKHPPITVPASLPTVASSPAVVQSPPAMAPTPVIASSPSDEAPPISPPIAPPRRVWEPPTDDVIPYKPPPGQVGYFQENVAVPDENPHRRQKAFEYMNEWLEKKRKSFRT